MSSLRLDGIQVHHLAAVDLDLAAGDLVFISGPSGSGKSLLLRAIADLDPHPGEVWLGSEARSAMAPSIWRRRVGLLPAESFWWADAVGAHFPEGVSMGCDLIHLLGRLGFAADVLGWSIQRLSTGERQRLALARLLAQTPEALLLDEATANLDPVNRVLVESVVSAYRLDRRAAVIWVSHDPEQRERLAATALGQAGGRQFSIRGGRLDEMRA